jgi:hypothetical protein
MPPAFLVGVYAKPAKVSEGCRGGAGSVALQSGQGILALHSQPLAGFFAQAIR